MKEYNWDNKEIVKMLLQSIYEYIKSDDLYEKKELLVDIDNLKEMINFSILQLPSIMPIKVNTKRYLDLDKEFLKRETTKFQRKKIKEYIPLASKMILPINGTKRTYKNDNLIEESLDFLNYLNPEIHNFLLSIIANKRLKINNATHELDFCGSTYSLQDDNFLEIILNSYFNPFITLNHEIIHGYFNSITKRRFDYENNYILYREVGSILIEIYSNNYLYINNLISYEEYVTNFIDVFYYNAYSEVEITDVLFELASNFDQKNNITTVKKFIKEKQRKDPTYDIKIKELIEKPLKNHLIYLYSSMVAISIYETFKDDQKGAINAALYIMANVTKDNEEQLFKKYKLNINNAFINYVDEYNELTKKKIN